MNSKRCTSTDVHWWHDWIEPVTVTCDGLARCGESVHPSHEIEVEMWWHCMGICDCGLSRAEHGPGDHK